MSARFSRAEASTGVFLTIVLAAQAVCPESASAFPPYRSTDANTADPYTLEVRIGLLRLDDRRRATDIASPLSRINFGLPTKLELISEFEFMPEKGRFGDGAFGAKWVPFFGTTFSFGNETLLLLPVRPGDRAMGVESQFVATYWSEELRVHMNAGGVLDARTSDVEEGWRASLLVEFLHNRFRPGLELFAKQIDNQEADVRTGAGLIYRRRALPQDRAQRGPSRRARICTLYRCRSDAFPSERRGWLSPEG